MQKVLPQFGVEVALKGKLVDLLGGHLADHPVISSVHQHVLSSHLFLLLLGLLRPGLGFFALLFPALLGRFGLDAFETDQVVDNGWVFELFCEVEGSFFVFIDEVVLAASVDEKFAHFQLSVPGRVEEAGLSVLVQVVDVAAEPDQQLCHLQSAKTGSPVEGRLLKLVQVRQVKVKP